MEEMFDRGAVVMQALEVQRRYSLEEYFALEEKAEFRSEYHDGRIVPMTGGSLNHNRIILSISAFLKYALRGQGFEPFSSDVKLAIPKYRRFTYPDVMVVQGKPMLYEGRSDTILNPCLIIEVLSKSTEERDRGDKFKYYRSIAELQEYVLIDQYEVGIQRFRKTEGELWIYQAYEEIEDTLRFESIRVEMEIEDIYEGIVFATDESGS